VSFPAPAIGLPSPYLTDQAGNNLLEQDNVTPLLIQSATISASVTPATLAVFTGFPAGGLTAGTSVTPGTLTVSTTFPAVRFSLPPSALLVSVAFPPPTVAGTVVISPALETYGFGSFAGIPTGSGVIQVIASIGQYGSNTGINGPSYQLWDGTSAQIGSTQQGQPSQFYENADEVTWTGVTLAQLPTLRLRIIAQSQAGNSGSVEAADWVALTVGYTPSLSAPVAPAALNVGTVFLAPLVAGVISATAPATPLAASCTFPGCTVGHISVGILNFPVSFPVTMPSVTVTTAPGVIAALTVWASFPVAAVAAASAMGYASSERVIAGGVGTWVNEANIDGPPDGNPATWTVP
jgi:hypothetical protein